MRTGALAAIAAVVALSACGNGAGLTARPTNGTDSTTLTTEPPTSTRAPGETGQTRDRERGPVASDGRSAPARLTIPALDLRDFAVVPYRGRTDDARGTDIQNGGALASPHGTEGGTGPGGIGNYQVTGHRLSSTMPFRFLPQLTRGEEVYVESGRTRYVYRIVTTRETSFRSPRSLRQQRAAVPGRPGVEPTRAMVTLSTCATLEDHAAGNFWADQFDNPDHRIDKIGVLVRSVPL